jgi:ferrous iron transport protein B
MSQNHKTEIDILLIGQPNVGKSVLFGRMTGIKTIASNYPGTTVSYAEGKLGVGDKKFSVVDAPGTYSLEPLDDAAQVAVDLLDRAKKIVNVIDATHLERNLPLTLELIEQGIPMVIALNMSDEAKHKGIEIDTEKLSKELGVPVVPTVARTSQGVNKLINQLMRLRDHKPAPADPQTHPGHHPHIPPVGEEDSDNQHSHLDRNESWRRVGEISSRVQSLVHRHHTVSEWLEDLSVHPVWGGFVAFSVLAFSLAAVRLIGEFLIAGDIGVWGEPWFNIPFGTELFFDTLWKPPMLALAKYLGSDSWLSHILIGTLIDGDIDFMQSFGVLTSGLFVPLGAVLPYIISFYLVISILEDTGYLPRLAVFLDNIMHKFGLHGYAIIPTMLGLGCNVPGIMATRILETTSQRFITATLISIAIPCSALQAMIIGFVGSYGFWPMFTVYFVLLINWVFIGLLLRWLTPGFAPGLLVEMPPYRLPQGKALWLKLKMRTISFLKEAVPIVMLSVLIVNIFYQFKIFDLVANLFSPLVSGLWNLPKEAIVPLLVGFLRKDVAVGLFGPLNLTEAQLVTGAIVLSMFFPCIATFSVLFREFGWKRTAKATGIMFVATVITGTAVRFLI